MTLWRDTGTVALSVSSLTPCLEWFPMTSAVSPALLSLPTGFLRQTSHSCPSRDPYVHYWSIQESKRCLQTAICSPVREVGGGGGGEREGEGGRATERSATGYCISHDGCVDLKLEAGSTANSNQENGTESHETHFQGEAWIFKNLFEMQLLCRQS